MKLVECDVVAICRRRRTCMMLLLPDNRNDVGTPAAARATGRLFMLADPTAPLMLEMRKRIGALKGKGVDILEACEKIVDGERALEKLRPTGRRFSQLEEACVDWIIKKASLPDELVSYLAAAEGPTSTDDGSSSDSSSDDSEANKAQKAAPSDQRDVHRESSGGVRQCRSKTTSKTTTSRLERKVNKYAHHLGLVAVIAVSENTRTSSGVWGRALVLKEGSWLSLGLSIRTPAEHTLWNSSPCVCRP